MSTSTSTSASRSRTLVALAVAASILLLAGLGLAGCNECGRRLFFFSQVQDGSGAPIAGAIVDLACRDAASGAQLTSQAVSDATGTAVPVVHALNRPCPDDRFAHSAYFESCTITVQASGFAERIIELDSQNLDDLPATDQAGNAGHGVILAITLDGQ